jgi:hypothetical protein
MHPNRQHLLRPQDNDDVHADPPSLIHFRYQPSQSIAARCGTMLDRDFLGLMAGFSALKGFVARHGQVVR